LYDAVVVTMEPYNCIITAVRCDIDTLYDDEICADEYRDGSLHAYMDDSPIVEYVRTTIDAKCQLRLVRSGFGEDAYGIGLPKNSNFKVR